MHEQEPGGLRRDELEIVRLRRAVEATLLEATRQAAAWAELMPGGNVDYFLSVEGHDFVATVGTPGAALRWDTQ